MFQHLSFHSIGLLKAGGQIQAVFLIMIGRHGLAAAVGFRVFSSMNQVLKLHPEWAPRGMKRFVSMLRTAAFVGHPTFQPSLVF